MVEKATSMIVDLFNKKPSDESISCHPEQIAGIDLGQIVSSHHPCHLKYILQGLPFFCQIHQSCAYTSERRGMSFMPFFLLLTDGLAYFEGLMENGCITSNLYILEKDYEEAYQSRGELDERIFINGEVSLMGGVSCDSPDISAYKVQTLPQFSFPPDLLSCDEDFCDNPITLPVIDRCKVSCYEVVQSIIDFD
jgi:hypothetical protein